MTRCHWSAVGMRLLLVARPQDTCARAPHSAGEARAAQAAQAISHSHCTSWCAPRCFPHARSLSRSSESPPRSSCRRAPPRPLARRRTGHGCRPHQAWMRMRPTRSSPRCGKAFCAREEGSFRAHHRRVPDDLQHACAVARWLSQEVAMKKVTDLLFSKVRRALRRPGRGALKMSSEDHLPRRPRASGRPFVLQRMGCLIIGRSRVRRCGLRRSFPTPSSGPSSKASASRRCATSRRP